MHPKQAKIKSVALIEHGIDLPHELLGHLLKVHQVPFLLLPNILQTALQQVQLDLLLAVPLRGGLVLLEDGLEEGALGQLAATGVF